MHDIRAVRSDPAGFDAALARRGLPPVSAELLAQDADRRAALTALQEKQARRNAVAREVGQGRRTGADTTAMEVEAAALRNETEALETQSAGMDDAIRRVLEGLPNVLDADVPDVERAREIGADRVEIYTGPYAEAFAHGDFQRELDACARTAERAHACGLGVNAGHDLNQMNLPALKTAVSQLAEVSVGHALICEALYAGLGETVAAYVKLLA